MGEPREDERWVSVRRQLRLRCSPTPDPGAVHLPEAAKLLGAIVRV